jgi:Transposase C of IS166 homeodomain
MHGAASSADHQLVRQARQPGLPCAFALEQNRLARVLWEQLEILQHQIAQLNRARFGVSSERLVGQAELFDAATDIPAPPAVDAIPIGSHTRKGRPTLPKDLPRTRIEYDLSDEQKMAFDTLERIGEEHSETLHYEPSKLTVIEHIRFKYVAKKDGESTIVTARSAVAVAQEQCERQPARQCPGQHLCRSSAVESPGNALCAPRRVFAASNAVRMETGIG